MSKENSIPLLVKIIGLVNLIMVFMIFMGLGNYGSIFVYLVMVIPISLLITAVSVIILNTAPEISREHKKELQNGKSRRNIFITVAILILLVILLMVISSTLLRMD